MVQQQVIAPPPVAPPPVLPPPTGIPPILAPATKFAPWIIPLVIPGGLLNPLPTANDQIDPRTGRPRLPQQPKPPRHPKPITPPTTAFPVERMLFLTFSELFLSLPWKYAGRK
ncbi:hypothetical protein [Nodularia sp. UHCC 0506]|uniref:hypothetical protein n=1 Tax=Nodularia sp. UHCC 0506 TaxID=3110243 RepID=UPI002B203379|nr:hypothetical protein [Nodularia sp. UHCC 0506]MEA5514772.1 hypothetical protein [Nodularia sp. UHCC 0506]